MMERLLPEVCKIQYGYAFDSAKFNSNIGVPLVRIRDVTRGFSETYTTEKCDEQYIVQNGDILIGMDGEFNIARWNGGKAYLNQRVCRLIPTDEVDEMYLYYFMPKALKAIEDKTPFVTVKHLSAKELNRIVVPIPTIEEQKEIANSLQGVDELISLRKQQLSKLDELVKSRFIELFGDPVGNPMGWPTQTMKNASIRLSDGPFGSNLKSSHYTAEGVRVIRLGNIGCGCFNDADRSFVPQEHYEKLKKYTCRAGEIVIATLGDPNLRACIIPDYIGLGINKSDCVHYIPKPDLLNNQFVCQYINCPETLVLASGMVHGQTRSRISSGQLADLPIFLPPIELQNQFAAFVEQTDKSKFAIQKSLEKLETLKKALMQKYFG